MKHWFLTAAGFLSLGLGVLGIFLPLLPTTPFVLLASACFMRSSPRFHRWLLNHAVFGPVIKNWQTRRAISPEVRRRGSFLMVITFTFSIWMAPSTILKIILFLFFIIALTIFRRLPVFDPVAHREENH
ncbi:Inner membrane protein YbaN [Vibrio aerogenes CECT 7868]|uniref:Inner membrane protein n=1 Tax=Vibrio aerogenes CECT 7868 TaxID=1216006 RepID=A0A1M5Z8S6_9VIBR|nr:YbaN family protein [Vibrio aerogenes]SHI20635.1 Inner membrane protein YbaN [Vibrio aerogenes CECT 7868]